MTRWIVWMLGVGLAALALYGLVTFDSAPPATDEIDAESRARLERLLEQEGDDP